MDIIINRAVKHMGIDYSSGFQSVSDSVARQLIDLGIAIKAVQYSNQDRVVGHDGRFTLRKALLAGDSIAAFAEVYAGVTSVTDNGDGTATVVRSSHSLGLGDPVRIVAAPSKSMNVMDSYVTQVVDANTIKIALGGRTHGVIAASSPNIVFPLRRSCRGWFNWVEAYLGEMFDTTWCAVGGATASKITTLIDETSIPSDVDIGFVCCGMNNIYAAGQSFSDIQAELAELIIKVRKKSAQLVVLSVPPRNSVDTIWSAAKQTVHNKINRWLYGFVKSIGGIYVDTWRSVQGGATYVNAGATNPDATTGMQYDYTHPSMRGAMAIGYDIASRIASGAGVRGYTAAHPSAIGTDTGNLLTGSAFSNGSGGVATGWASSDTTANMTVTPSLVSRTVAADGDACGQNQIISFSYGTASSAGSTRFRLNNFQALLTPGTKVQFRFPFKLTGAVGLNGLELTMLGARSDSSFWFVMAMNQDSNASVVSGDFSGYLITPPAIVPPDLTDLDAWVRPYITSAQSSALTLTLWQPELIVIG